VEVLTGSARRAETNRQEGLEQATAEFGDVAQPHQMSDFERAGRSVSAGDR
jgi:hypothetical protein